MSECGVIEITENSLFRGNLHCQIVVRASPFGILLLVTGYTSLPVNKLSLLLFNGPSWPRLLTLPIAAGLHKYHDHSDKSAKYP